MSGQPTLGFTVCHASGKSNVFIKDIESDGPADKAGLQVGDEVISINGVAIPDMGSFKTQTKSLTVGQHLNIRVWRYLVDEGKPGVISCEVVVNRRRSVEDLRSATPTQKLGKGDVDQAFGKFFAKEVPATGYASKLEAQAAAQPTEKRRSLRRKFISLFH